MRLPGPAVLLALLLVLPRPAPGEAAGGEPRREILVFAAASLADALTEVGRAFEAAGRPGARTKVTFNFAGSNDLARQIEAGAPAHLFVSANREQVERLERSGRVPPGASFDLLGNRLVVVVPRGSPARELAGARGLLAFDRLSLADPEGVPAGVYARQWLERAGLWTQVAPRVVPALDVRAALAAVAAGNVPAGVVYATDAASSDRVRVVYRVPDEAAPPVRYVAAPVMQKDGPPLAGWLAFLRGPRAREIFARHGFAVLPPARPPAPAHPGSGS